MKRRTFLQMLGIGSTVPVIDPVLAKFEERIANGESLRDKIEPIKEEIPWEKIEQHEVNVASPITEGLIDSFDGKYTYWEVTHNQDMLSSISDKPIYGHTTKEIMFTAVGLCEDIKIGEDKIIKINNEKYHVHITSVSRRMQAGHFPETDVHGIII